MKHSLNSPFWVICFVIFCSFHSGSKPTSAYPNIEKYERLALQSCEAGKVYVVDLTGIEGCNKTKVKYLGLVTTRKGMKYKVLTSFFVFPTSKNMCRGTSKIKIYDLTNKFIGYYNVGIPDKLPDTLINNKLVYTNQLDECPLREKTSINLSNGLPSRVFVPCSKMGGNIYAFE